MDPTEIKFTNRLQNPGDDVEYLQQFDLDLLKNLRSRTDQSIANLREYRRKVDQVIEKKMMEGQPTLFEPEDEP